MDTNRTRLLVASLAVAALLAPSRSRAGEAVPFRGLIAATAAPAGPCVPASGGPGLLLQISGGGNLTQMGAVTDEQSHCLSLTTFAFTGGAFTFTSANGETVFGTYAGQFAPNPSGGNLFLGEFEVTGGTGRFAGATGGGQASGTENAGNALLLLNGTITSVGSRK